MLENIKKRIIHFYTRGNIIEDFVESRRRKTVKLRRIIRACFYIQCALAAGCIAAALLMSTSGASAIVAGSIAVCVVAFISLGGGTAEKTILYILDLAYAVICFIVGGLGGSGAFILCGVLMLLSAGAALGGFFAAWCRQYLLDFSPAKITRSDYTRLTLGMSEPPPEPARMVPPSLPPPPPPPPKSEMEMLADRLSGILGAIPEIKLAGPEDKGRESGKGDTGEQAEQDTDEGEATEKEDMAAEDAAAAPAEVVDEVIPEVKAESAAPAVLPKIVDISDMSVDFSIDG